MKKLLRFSLLYFICLMAGPHALGQQEGNTFRYQLSIDTDNDAFIHWENFDRYYTYGFGARLSFRTDSLLGLQRWFKQKQEYYFSAGFRSEAFTPTHLQSQGMISEDPLDFDRPFAGLLFGTFETNYVFKRSYFRMELLAGLMGPSALSGDIQRWIHDNIVIGGELEGWAFQIPDQPILNLHATYGLGISTGISWLEPYTKVDMRFGNLYIDAGASVGLRIGLFNPYNRSVTARNGFLSGQDRKLFFYQGSVSGTLVAFDGTAQGALFARAFEYGIDELSHVHGSMSHGIYWGNSRMVLGFDTVFNYNKVIPRSRHIYGRIDFRYRFN